MNHTYHDRGGTCSREQGFSEEGQPDLRVSAAERRVMRDEVVQWNWLQARCTSVRVDASTNQTTEHHRRWALTESEAFDYQVLHYLIVHAYPEEAAAYIRERGMDGREYVCKEDPMSVPRVRPAYMRVDAGALLAASKAPMRAQLRQAIEAGDMRGARRLVHRHTSPGGTFWGAHPELLLRLQLQHFVELVRAGRFESALTFAQREIAPFGEANPGYLHDVEHVFRVLAVDPNAAPEHVDVEARWLLGVERRCCLSSMPAGVRVHACTRTRTRTHPRTFFPLPRVRPCGSLAWLRHALLRDTVDALLPSSCTLFPKRCISTPRSEQHWRL